MSSFASWRIVVFAISMAISAFAGNSFRFIDDSIQFAAIIHRHGDRSPLKTYPNDPHNNYKWPGGRGALSPLGSHQMFTLGKNLRHRYLRLLPADGLYSAERMQVMSSARERTLMSSQSFLAGFLPPPSDRNPLPIPWQPISIHSISPDMDTFILQKTPCPKYLQTYLHLSQHPPPEFRKFYEENAEWFEYLTNHTGMNVTRAEEALIVWDVLLVEHSNNLTLPAWTEAIFPERLRAIAEMGLLVPLQTPYMRLQRGGPMISRIVGQMREKQNGIAPNRSLYIYSAHDSTLLSIIRLLNLTDQTTGIPSYGATLAFELHCAENDNCGQMEVRIVYYFEYTDKKPKPLAIPNCPAPCTLDRFTESINDIINFDYVNMCKLDSASVMNGEFSENDLETLNRN